MSSAVAQSAPAAAAPSFTSSNRYLFVFETTSLMQREVEASRQAVIQLLSSRANGQLRYGDTVGVWTYDAEVHTGNFPLQFWRPGSEGTVAPLICGFLKQQSPVFKSDFQPAMDAVKEIIKQSDIITVFLFNTGADPIHGTPFDKEINEAYARDIRQMRKKRMPIVTVLVAKEGKVVEYTVNPLPWPVIMPELPFTIRVEAAKAVGPVSSSNLTVHANTPAPVASGGPSTLPPRIESPKETVSTPPAPHKVEPAAVAPPVVKTPEKPLEKAGSKPAIPVPPVVVEAPPQKSPPAETASAIPPVVPPVTKPVAKSDSAPVSPQPAPIPTPPVAVPAASPTPVASAEVPAAPKRAVSVPSTAPVPVPPLQAKAGESPKEVEAARSKPSESQAPDVSSSPTNTVAIQTAAALPPVPETRSNGLLIAALLLLAVAGVLAVLMIQRSKTPAGPSLITQSMNRNKK